MIDLKQKAESLLDRIYERAESSDPYRWKEDSTEECESFLAQFRDDVIEEALSRIKSVSPCRCNNGMQPINNRHFSECLFAHYEEIVAQLKSKPGIGDKQQET